MDQQWQRNESFRGEHVPEIAMQLGHYAASDSARKVLNTSQAPSHDRFIPVTSFTLHPGHMVYTLGHTHFLRDCSPTSPESVRTHRTAPGRL